MLPQTKPSKTDPVTRSQDWIDRMVGEVAGRPLVLFYKSGLSLVGDNVNYPELMRSLGAGPVIELQDPDWDWCSADAGDFNCHALAIGSGAGMLPCYWLEGFASRETLFENPAQIMLDHFYDRQDETIDVNDIFVLRDSNSGGLVHSGFLRRVDGVNFAVSKFGEGPVCLTSFELIAMVYRGKFDQVRWYRRNRVGGLSVDSSFRTLLERRLKPACRLCRPSPLS